MNDSNTVAGPDRQSEAPTGRDASVWGRGVRPLISFAMPTYNNAVELEETLRSIIPQVLACDEPVEIVISDNASTDATERICRELAERHGFVTYRRNDHNLGFDMNILNALEASAGEYCWLFGDDLLLPGMLATVVSATRRHRPDLVSLNYAYHYDGKPLERPAQVRAMSLVKEPVLVHGNDALIRLRLLYFTFISSNVVRRVPDFIEATRNDDLRGFAHLFYILRVCRQGTALLLPDLAVVTQWTHERPAQPPPLATFTIDLPAIFTELAARGYLSRDTAQVVVNDIDFFMYPRFWPAFLDLRQALSHGSDDERRCAAAVLSRLPVGRRLAIAHLPNVFIALVKVRAVLRLRRGVVQNDPEEQRLCRARFASLALWKRLIVVATPINTIDRAIATTRRFLAGVTRPSHSLPR
jgi:glycosyltransferase involved in cell wall biosynthesis